LTNNPDPHFSATALKTKAPAKSQGLFFNIYGKRLALQEGFFFAQISLSVRKIRTHAICRQTFYSTISDNSTYGMSLAIPKVNTRNIGGIPCIVPL
jgi:hypothetical protein